MRIRHLVPFLLIFVGLLVHPPQANAQCTCSELVGQYQMCIELTCNSRHFVTQCSSVQDSCYACNPFAYSIVCCYADQIDLANQGGSCNIQQTKLDGKAARVARVYIRSCDGSFVPIIIGIQNRGVETL
jgi:hypothetical protein